MNKQRKIYVVGGDNAYANWMEGTIVRKMKEADLVVFTGGEDVDPAIYGRKPHPTTGFNPIRDRLETQQFKEARNLGKPMIGICRGSQFLCVMSGGLLVQHQHHPGRHEISTDRLGEITVTSTHHQRQWPWNLPEDNYRVLGWCNLSPFSQGASADDDLRFCAGVVIDGLELPEVEIAYYPKTNALAIQSHPEYCYPPTETWEVQYINACRDLLDELLKGRL